MSTKTLKNPRTIAKLKGKTLNLAPYKKQQRYKIPIRNNLKKSIKSVQKPYRKEAA